jgi:hypothetical protein
MDDYTPCPSRRAVPRKVSLRRLAGGACGLGFIGMILGCMSFTFGGRQELVGQFDDPSCFRQGGRLTIQAGHEIDVYYAIPYQSPPNLVLDDESAGPRLKSCEIREQFPDHFRVRNPGIFPVEVAWTARGMRSMPAPPPTVPAPAILETSPPPQMPMPVPGHPTPSL